MANRYPLIVDTTIKELASGDTLVADNLTLSGTTPTLIISATGVLNIPTGTTAQRPGGTPLGSFRYNTTDGSFEGYSATGWGEIGGGGANLTTNNYTGDGSTAFTLGIDPSVEQNTFVYIDGVYQFKNTYSTSGTTLTFSTAPPTGALVEVMSMTATNSIVGTVSDNAITTAKIQDLNVTTDKIANLNVTTGKIADINVTTGKIADDAVTLAKMAGGTDGQVITYDASGDPVAVGPGASGQILTSTGDGSPPAFEDAGGAYSAWDILTTTPTNLEASGQYICNDTTARIHTLPAASAPGNVGDTVIISNIGTGTVTVARNGSNINSTASDATLLYNRSTQLVYVSDAIGWKEIP